MGIRFGLRRRYPIFNSGLSEVLGSNNNYQSENAMNKTNALSETLQPMYDYEINRGNHVNRIDSPAGTNCPLAIIFCEQLDISGFITRYGMPNGVMTWENLDRHYPIEKGYVCERTRHALAGPLKA